jgi:hypothetical protein
MTQKATAEESTTQNESLTGSVATNQGQDHPIAVEQRCPGIPKKIRADHLVEGE